MRESNHHERIITNESSNRVMSKVLLMRRDEGRSTVVRGVVTDENGNAVEGAQVRVEGVGKHVTTSSRYHTHLR